MTQPTANLTEVPDTLQDALDELRGYARDVKTARFPTLPGALQRYMSRLNQEPLSTAVSQALPEVDFRRWYSEAVDSCGAMGADPLNWPTSIRERTALQAKLLQCIVDDEIRLLDHLLAFHRTSSGFTSYAVDFVAQTFVPFHRDLSLILHRNHRRDDEAVDTGRRSAQESYVDKERRYELATLETDKFDLKRLINLCDELNRCYRQDCYHAVAALTRSLLDHVPPIFGVSTFSEVANNYGGSSSFKKSMSHLGRSARNIADAHLHTQVRRTEILPTRTQINFSQDVDVLLSEVVRIIRSEA